MNFILALLALILLCGVGYGFLGGGFGGPYELALGGALAATVGAVVVLFVLRGIREEVAGRG